MGKCSGRSMALLALTISLPEITRAAAANPSKLAAQARVAALAYLTRPQVENIPPDVNPGSIYCSGLGGTDLFGGMNVAGGGWVEEHNKDVPVLQACVFPDQSVIDSFGIFYHAKGIVRGVDLTSSFAYQSANPPFVFGN